MAGSLPPEKAKPGSEIWGLGGQLLVLLLHDTAHFNGHNKLKSSSSQTIMSRAQSTISVCVVLVLITFLLFALSTFESSDSPSLVNSRPLGLARRWLSDSKVKTKGGGSSATGRNKRGSFALQGMGALFRRGSRGMTDLLVVHVNEDVRPPALRLFLRTLHRSSITAKADVVFLYSFLSPLLKSIIEEENQSFAGLLQLNESSFILSAAQVSPFDAAHFRPRHNGSDTIWGTRGRGGGKGMEETGGYAWGSVVGFATDELDAEGALAGFFDDEVPVQVRRWACYRMLLGRLRHNIRHTMLMGVNDGLIVGDPFARVRNKKAGEWVAVADNVIVGGARAVRRLSDVMLVEIARVRIQRKNKKAQSDHQILAHMMKNENSILRQRVKLGCWEELVPENTIFYIENMINQESIEHSPETTTSNNRA